MGAGHAHGALGGPAALHSPAWLQHAHRELDQTVTAAYCWQWPLPDDEVLERLFTLNQERAEIAPNQ